MNGVEFEDLRWLNLLWAVLALALVGAYGVVGATLGRQGAGRASPRQGHADLHGGRRLHPVEDRTPFRGPRAGDAVAKAPPDPGGAGDHDAPISARRVSLMN